MHLTSFFHEYHIIKQYASCSYSPSVYRYPPVKYVTPQVEHISQVPLQTAGSKENALSDINSHKTVNR